MLIPGVIQASSDAQVVVINIVGVNTNINLRTIYDASYPTPTPGATISFIFGPSADLKSSSAGIPSVRTGLWPVGVVPLLDATAVPVSWKGAGGGGGLGPGVGHAGAAGGIAFLAEAPVDFDGLGATLAGGGGGGGGTSVWPSMGLDYQAGGGGGAGNVPGAAGAATIPGGNDAAPGTTTAGGQAGNFASDPNQPSEAGGGGGNGGGLGLPGIDAGDVSEPGSEGNVGGAAGYSVSGFSLVNFLTSPTFVGPTTG